VTKHLRVLAGFGLAAIIIGTVAMRLTVRLRQREHTIPIYLSSSDGAYVGLRMAQECADIVAKRIGYLRKRFALTKSGVSVDSPTRLRVVLMSHLDIEPLKRTLVKSFAIELRTVLDYDYAGGPDAALPQGAEVLDEVQRMYNLRHIGQVDLVHTPRLVVKTPALVIKRLESSKFVSYGFRRDPVIEIKMNPQDAARFAEVTRKHVDKHLAVVLDGEIKTAPLVQAPLTEGRAEIRGIIFKQEARDIAAFLDMGALPCAASLTPR